MSEYLLKRGLSLATQLKYKIEASTYDARPTVKYPTLGMGGDTGYRHKFTDGNKPKYKWHGQTEQAKFKYYSAGGMKKAIDDCGGLLYWLSGEPDVWTWFETNNGYNAVSCFGEGSVPESVAADLAFLGVKRVVMYPDLDEPGMKAAGKLWRYLQGSGIELMVRRIPGELGSKCDLNQLWQDVKFDTMEFDATCLTAEELTDVELELYAPPVKSEKAQQPELNFDGLYHEWIEMVIRALGHWDNREGSVERWHCPLPGHDDKHPSFRVARGAKIPMPMCTCNIQDKEPTDAWDAVAKARNVDTWAEYKTRKRAESGTANPIKPALVMPPVIQAVDNLAQYVVDSHTIYNEMLDELEGLSVPDLEFVECPYKVLHQFGGFAEIMFPGKLVYIVGISGGGKTSFGEFGGEVFLKQGYDFLWYGPEWTPKEMGYRALQRAGGLDTIHMSKVLTYNAQAARGIPDEYRKGVPLQKHEQVDSHAKVINMASWAGRAHYLSPAANRLPLTDMLNVARLIVQRKRDEGRKMIAFYFDYLQRANKGGRSQGAFWSEEVISEIKAFCEEMSLIGFVMVQPKKTASEDVRAGDSLSEADGQGISDQQCNLYISLNPMFDDNQHMLKQARIKVVKNSMGRLGDVVTPTDFSKLTWIDKPMIPVKVDLGGAS
jgi:hypothetical protein